MTGVRPALGRREAVIGGVLLAASGVAFALQPRRVETHGPIVTDAALPDRIGAFREDSPVGFILPQPGPLTRNTYVNVLTRLYRAEGSPAVMLLIAQGRAEDAGMTVHRPERCYRASGFSVDRRTNMALPPPFPPGSQASCLTVRRDGRSEQVLFWTRVGPYYPLTALDQRLANARENLAGVLPDGILLRLSVVSDDAVAVFALLQSFHAALIAAMPGPARKRLMGL